MDVEALRQIAKCLTARCAAIMVMMNHHICNQSNGQVPRPVTLKELAGYNSKIDRHTMYRLIADKVVVPIEKGYSISFEFANNAKRVEPKREKKWSKVLQSTDVNSAHHGIYNSYMCGNTVEEVEQIAPSPSDSEWVKVEHFAPGSLPPATLKVPKPDVIVPGHSLMSSNWVDEDDEDFKTPEEILAEGAKAHGLTVEQLKAKLAAQEGVADGE